jgi:hypothetical protein
METPICVPAAIGGCQDAGLHVMVAAASVTRARPDGQVRVRIKLVHVRVKHWLNLQDASWA